MVQSYSLGGQHPSQPNTCFPTSTRVHITNSISISSAVFAQLTTTECPILYNAPPPSPSILPFPMRDLDLHLIYCSLGPPESSFQTASRSVQPFLHGSLVRQTDRFFNIYGPIFAKLCRMTWYVLQ